MPTSTRTDGQLQRYRALRRDGVGAATAYRSATAAPPTVLGYRTGPGEQITFVGDDRPDLSEFTVTAITMPDPDPDTSWLGEFLPSWSPGAIEVNQYDPRSYQYFVPTYTVAQRRADLSDRGYARGRAHELAECGVRDDARLALELDCRIVTVEVRKAGVLLGTASLGTDFCPDESRDDQLAAVACEYGLIDEAVAHAHTVLPELIAALAA